MVAGSILPVSLYKNNLYFLFGKENTLETNAKGWSDFGGGCENSETPLETAKREGAEELSGFLGNDSDISNLLKSGFHKIVHEDYHIHICCVPYDANLPMYYNNHHKFLWGHDNIDVNHLHKSKLFEKCELRWFSEGDLVSKRKIFRHFYQDMVEKILDEIPSIRKLVRKQNRNTRRNR